MLAAVPAAIPSDWTPDIPMAQLAQIVVVLGFLVPWVAALLNRPQFSTGIKQTIVLGLSVVTSIFALSLTGQLKTGNALTTALLVLAGAVWFYNNYWGKTVKDFEAITSPKSPIPEPLPDDPTDIEPAAPQGRVL